jgi:peroxiredoxin
MGRAAVLGAVWLAIGLGSWTVGEASTPLPLTLVDPLSGEQVEITAGAPVLHVVFFATWCPACVDELDRLADLQARWEQSGYRLFLVAVATRQDPERLSRFAAERRPPGRLLHDAEGRAQAAFRAGSLPAHFLLDQRGAVFADGSALDGALVNELEQFLRTREKETGPGE